MKKPLLFGFSLAFLIGVLSTGITNAYSVDYGTAEYNTGIVGDSDARNNFHYKEITITSGSESIIIMDRNLGAMTGFDGIDYATPRDSIYDTPNDYYGYYYQWGNNYGFSSGSVSTSGDTPGIGITMPSTFSSSTWYTSEINYDSSKDLWGDTTNTNEARKGPCPTGWHVPKKTEIEWLKSLTTDDWETYFGGELKFPNVGMYSNNHEFQDTSNSVYWLSNATDSSVGVLNNGDIYWYGSYNGAAVRCIKNTSCIGEAKVGNTCYDTVKEAFDDFSANSNSLSGNITILKDATYNNNTLRLINKNEVQVVVDLGGHTLTLNYPFSTNGTTFKNGTIASSINGKAILINDSNVIFESDLNIEFDGGSYIEVGPNSSSNDTDIHLSINGSTIISSGTVAPILVKYGSKVVINSGTIAAESTSAMTVESDGGWYDPTTNLQKKGIIEINSGSITSNSPTAPVLFASGSYASITIAGGTISGSGAQVINEAVLNINGGIFSAQPTNTDNDSNTDDGTINYSTGKTLIDQGDGTYQLGDATTFVITWYNDDNTFLSSGEVASGAMPSYTGTPTKTTDDSCTYTFNGWTPELTGATENTGYTATFTCNPKSTGSSYSGGGGRSKSTVSTPTTGDIKNEVKEETKDEEKNDNKDKDTPTVEKSEFEQAYEFAFENGITTMPTIEEADMESPLTRIAMAKMLSQYAINILKKTPDTTKECKFSDVSEKLDTDYNNGVTLACQLGIMGVGIKEFRPNDNVIRAEFATALSRLLFGTKDGTDIYYTTHLAKLMEEGIITNDDPDLEELRGYVMIMLMRSAM